MNTEANSRAKVVLARCYARQKGCLLSHGTSRSIHCRSPLSIHPSLLYEAYHDRCCRLFIIHCTGSPMLLYTSCISSYSIQHVFQHHDGVEKHAWLNANWHIWQVSTWSCSIVLLCWDTLCSIFLWRYQRYVIVIAKYSVVSNRYDISVSKIEVRWHFARFCLSFWIMPTDKQKLTCNTWPQQQCGIYGIVLYIHYVYCLKTFPISHLIIITSVLLST